MTDAWQPPNAPPPNTPPGAPPPTEGAGIPWENEQNAQSLFETLKLLLFDPDRTFAGASQSAGFGASFTFAMIFGFAGGLIAALWGFLTTSSLVPLLEQIPEEYRETVASFATPSVMQLVFVPVGVVIALFIMAGVTHLALLIVGGANGRFEDTLRAVGFAMGAVSVFRVIPVVGDLVYWIWGIVVAIFAVKNLHRTTTGKAVLAVLLPMLLFIVCCCCGAIAIGASVGRMMGQQ